MDDNEFRYGSRQIYDVTPMGAVRMNRADSWKKRPAVLRYRAYKDEIRLRRVFLPDECRIIFHLPMPDSWSAKKRAEHIGQPHKQKPDIDNLVKALFDSLYEDDAHIWRVNAEKRWAETGAIEVVRL